MAIVGRPNVGKSSLFNRIVRAPAAIVADLPGVTRDRLYRAVEWQGRAFALVDTGGLLEEEGEGVFAHIRAQVQTAIREAAVVVLVVDARAGITPADEAVAQLLRRSRRPVVVAANKVDHPGVDAGEAFRLGLGEPEAVSAAHGHGVAELLDRVVALLPPAEAPAGQEDGAVRVALVGRPNVGKSTLLNRLVGEERSLVAPEPGTTVDPVDATVLFEGRLLSFVDTAGLRRRARVEQELERRAAQRAQATLRRADVAVVVLDARADLSEQDRRIAGYAHDFGHPVVFACNKWDLVPAAERDPAERELRMKELLPALAYAPMVFVSAHTGENVAQLLRAVVRAYEASRLSVPTHALNRSVAEATLLTPPPSYQGRRLKIYYATQTGVAPPEFLFFVNDPELVHFSYRRYLENELRRRFAIGPTPIRLTFRARPRARARSAPEA